MKVKVKTMMLYEESRKKYWRRMNISGGRVPENEAGKEGMEVEEIE